MDGVFSGMLDIYYAEMSTPETASSAPVLVSWHSTRLPPWAKA